MHRASKANQDSNPTEYDEFWSTHINASTSRKPNSPHVTVLFDLAVSFCQPSCLEIRWQGHTEVVEEERFGHWPSLLLWVLQDAVAAITYIPLFGLSFVT